MATKKPLTVEAIAKSPQLVSYRKLSPELVRQVLARLEGVAGFQSAFAREAMRQAPEAPIEQQWARTSEALSKAGRQYSLGDAAFRETLELMQAPWLLAACQAGTIASGPPLVVAAALAKDGSDASHDALMADFERARAGEDDWPLRYKLKRLSKYAKPNAAWKALEAAVKRELERRDGLLANDTQNVARQLGLDLPLLKWSLYLRGSGGTMIWVSINDQHSSAGLQYLRRDGSREPDLQDIRSLPARLKEIAERDKLTWNWGEAQISTNLRGAKRAAMLEWAQGKRPSPALD